MYSTGASSLSTSFYSAQGVPQCHTRAIGRIDKSWRNHMILYQPKAEYIYINKVLCSQDRGTTVTIWFWVWDMHQFCSNECTIVHSSRRRIELAFGQ